MTNSENGFEATMLLWLLAVIVMLAHGRYGMAALDAFLPPVGVVHGAVIIFGWIF